MSGGGHSSMWRKTAFVHLLRNNSKKGYSQTFVYVAGITIYDKFVFTFKAKKVSLLGHF